MPSQTPSYLFLLGSAPELSWWELSRTLPINTNLSRLSSHVAAVSHLPKSISPQDLIETLGGIVKIAHVLAALPDNQPTTATQAIVEQLLVIDQNRIEFALAEWGRDHLPKLDPFEVKELLTDAGRSVRFRTGPRVGISAAITLHQSSVQEMVIATTDQGTYLASTVAVQNIDQWQKRDRQKPFAQHRRGLLPPKVARMLVTGAIGPALLEQNLGAVSLWDPFCGSGTILMEGMVLGITAQYGSDLDQVSVEGTQRNLVWLQGVLKNQSTESAMPTVFQADATNMQSPPFVAESISHLVTEPFLGKPTPQASQVPNIKRGLEKMFRGAFKQWRTWLKPGATVICIIPKWSVEKNGRQHEVTLHELIDFIGTIGYTTASGPIVYARPNAIVQREIWQFTFAGNK